MLLTSEMRCRLHETHNLSYTLISSHHLSFQFMLCSPPNTIVIERHQSRWPQLFNPSPLHTSTFHIARTHVYIVYHGAYRGWIYGALYDVQYRDVAALASRGADHDVLGLGQSTQQ